MAKGIKTGGRTKGTPNKITASIRETLADVLNDYTTENLKNDLDSLTPYERIKVTTGLYRLTLPPMKQQDQEDNKDIQPIIINLGRGTDPNSNTNL
jgi:hypothetical protein